MKKVKIIVGKRKKNVIMAFPEDWRVLNPVVGAAR